MKIEELHLLIHQRYPKAEVKPAPIDQCHGIDINDYMCVVVDRLDDIKTVTLVFQDVRFLEVKVVGPVDQVLQFIDQMFYPS